MRMAQRRGVIISVTMNCGFKPSSQAVVVFVMKHSGIAKCTQPRLPLTKPAAEVATLGPVPIHRGFVSGNLGCLTSGAPQSPVIVVLAEWGNVGEQRMERMAQRFVTHLLHHEL